MTILYYLPVWIPVSIGVVLLIGFLVTMKKDEGSARASYGWWMFCIVFVCLACIKLLYRVARLLRWRKLQHALEVLVG